MNFHKYQRDILVLCSTSLTGVVGHTGAKKGEDRWHILYAGREEACVALHEPLHGHHGEVSSLHDVHVVACEA